MAIGYSTETAGVGQLPQVKINDVAQRGRKKILRNTIVLTGAVGQQAGDQIYLGKRPAGSRFSTLTFQASASLGTAIVSIGITGTVAKYRAALAFTTPLDTPVFQVVPTARLQDVPLTADEDIYAFITVAALPGAGIWIIDIEYIES